MISSHLNIRTHVCFLLPLSARLGLSAAFMQVVVRHSHQIHYHLLSWLVLAFVRMLHLFLDAKSVTRSQQSSALMSWFLVHLWTYWVTKAITLNVRHLSLDSPLYVVNLSDNFILHYIYLGIFTSSWSRPSIHILVSACREPDVQACISYHQHALAICRWTNESLN